MPFLFNPLTGEFNISAASGGGGGGPISVESVTITGDAGLATLTSSNGTAPSNDGVDLLVKAGNGIGNNRSGGDLTIRTGNKGSGMGQPGSISFQISSTGTKGWDIDTSGSFIARADGVQTIGKQDDNRPQYIFVTNKITVGPQEKETYVGTGVEDFLGTDGTQISLVSINTNAEAGPRFAAQRVRGLNFENVNPVDTGDYLGVFQADGCISTSYNLQPGPKMRMEATETWSESSLGSKIVFSTLANASISSSDALTIDQDGSTIAHGTLQAERNVQIFGAASVAYTRKINVPDFTISDGIGAVILDFNGIQSTAEIVMPAAPFDGQQISFGSGPNGIPDLTLSPNIDQEINSPITSLTEGQTARYMYSEESATWYKIG